MGVKTSRSKFLTCPFLNGPHKNRLGIFAILKTETFIISFNFFQHGANGREQFKAPLLQIAAPIFQVCAKFFPQWSSWGFLKS